MKASTILDDCLERLKAGETVADCLVRYPEQAQTLAPMLQAAAELRTLAAFRLSHGQKLRAKVTMRAALAERTAPRPPLAWLRLRAMPAAAMLSLVLFIALTVSAVASSQPGDLGYSLRVASERVPVFVQFGMARQAKAELVVAERRLTESQGAHPSALAALIVSEEAIVRRAERLTLDEQIEIAERVSAHAQALVALAERADDPAMEARLAHAAKQVHAIAGRLVTPLPTPTLPVWPTVKVEVTPSVTPVAVVEPVSTRTPRPRITEMWPSVTPRRPLATLTLPARPPVTPRATLQPGAWPTMTPWAWPTGNATWVPGATVIPATRTPLVPRPPRTEITPPAWLPTGTVIPPRYLPTATPAAIPLPSVTVRYAGGGIALTATAIAPLPSVTETPRPPRDFPIGPQPTPIPPVVPEVTVTLPAPPRSR